MKTTLQNSLGVLGCFFSTLVLSQTLPNSGFENWNTMQYNEPVSWISSNQESIPKIGAITSTSVTGFVGSALRLQTKVLGQDTIVAYVMHGSLAGDPISGQGGMPYSQKPAFINGYYRYNLPGNDTALMYISFKKNGVVLTQNWIKIRGTGTQNIFTAFSFSLSAPTMSVNPDSVIIAVASGNVLNNTGIQNNSFLEIDGLAFSGNGATQPIANGGFEAWSALTSDQLSSWGQTGESITKITPGYSGSFAVELQTKSYPGNFVGQSGITNGFYTQNGPPKGGRPYTQSLDTLYGYYKFSGSNDSGVVFVSLTKLGAPVGMMAKYLKNKTNWTLFKLPLQAGMSPDTLRIEIYSSQPGGNNSTAVGSKLSVDNLFLYSQPNFTALKTNAPGEKLNIFPNPVKSTLTITFDPSNIYQATVLDISGRTVYLRSESAIPGEIQFNVESLTKGIYLLLLENKGSATYYRFIKE